MSESPALPAPIARRRTFAIIAHPDAGKTTLTEKLLLFGGAIQMAGAVKARGDRRRARSDWMKVERERGISVTTSVMTFDFEGCIFNLLDTPGHEDFSEDTYRTLTAVDSAVMVLDAAKGIETQTRKLFEVCRLRDVPIATFVNKMDRDGRDPFEIIDEVANDLQLEVTPASWPIGSGKEFLGCYDLFQDQLYLMERSKGERIQEGITCKGLDDPKLDELLPPNAVAKLREDVAMVRELCPKFDLEAYRMGYQTPVFFGSAVNNFGVRELLSGLGRLAPPPRAQPCRERKIEPSETKVSGFVFKIQANMDKAHRDRVAFFRVCSGKFERNMKVNHVRTGKQIRLANPTTFMAQERTIVEDGYAGDVIGLYDPGIFEIGDTLTAGKPFLYPEIPSFSPEHFVRVSIGDPMRRKQMRLGLEQLAQEGTIQLYVPERGGDPILGAVGQMQLEVVKYRLAGEYNVAARFEGMACEFARWVARADGKEFDILDFDRQRLGIPCRDVRGRAVVLFAGDWQFNSAKREMPGIVYGETARGLVAVEMQS